MAPSRIRSIAPLAVALISGVAAGTIAAAVFSRASTRGAAPSATAPVSREEARDPTRDRAPDRAGSVPVRGIGDNGQLVALDQRLRAVENAAASSAPNAVEPPPDPEVARAEHERDHEVAVQSHWREPVDPVWSAASAATFQTDLTQAGQDGQFGVVRVDCRNTSCISVLEWPSYAEAVQHYHTVLRQPYGVNCGREILLPEPTDPAAPYQATAVFDCSNFRAAER